MKTIKIEKFSGLEDCEKMEVARNATDIYKFFKLLNYGDFDLVDTKNQIDFQSVLDGLCNFLPFVKRNYDTIIEFNDDCCDDDAGDFLSEIDRTVEETIRNNNLNVTLTSDDIVKYSTFSSDISERIEEKIADVDNDDLIEFLKKHGLVAEFYSEYCN
jgi:hypothetical protein